MELKIIYLHMFIEIEKINSSHLIDKYYWVILKVPYPRQ